MMIYPMVSAGARAKLEKLLQLEPTQAIYFRFCGLLLLAHEVLVAFHENPGLRALSLRCDFDKNAEHETYQASARDFFVNWTGELDRRISIDNTTVPLSLLGAGELLVERDHPVVEASLQAPTHGDSILHSRLMHELAWELNAAYFEPSQQPMAS